MTMIRICLLVVVKYLQKILNKLVIKLSEPISTDRVRLVDVTTKSNNMKIFMFRCDYVYYIDAIESIVQILNDSAEFRDFGKERVFIISTVYSNGISFPFLEYTKTCEGKISDSFLNLIKSKYSRLYLEENYGSVEEFNSYKVVCRSIL